MQFIRYIMLVALKSMLLIILKGIVSLWNKISFAVVIMGHVPQFLSLHFAIFALFGAAGLVLCAF